MASELRQWVKRVSDDAHNAQRTEFLEKNFANRETFRYQVVLLAKVYFLLRQIRTKVTTLQTPKEEKDRLLETATVLSLLITKQWLQLLPSEEQSSLESLIDVTTKELRRTPASTRANNTSPIAKTYLTTIYRTLEWIDEDAPYPLEHVFGRLRGPSCDLLNDSYVEELISWPIVFIGPLASGISACIPTIFLPNYVSGTRCTMAFAATSANPTNTRNKTPDEPAVMHSTFSINEETVIIVDDIVATGYSISSIRMAVQQARETVRS